MTAIYASTAPHWLSTVRTLSGVKELAFWQPTPAMPSRITAGERWYFKELGRPLIHGFGLFKRWESLSLADLFRRYGVATGYNTIEELVRGMQEFRKDARLGSVVGNVVLSNFQEFMPPMRLQDFGLEDLSVRFQYIPGIDPFASISTNSTPRNSDELTDPNVQSDLGRGPTTGVTPSSWSSTVVQSADAPAFVYALRFGRHNIWKIGWAIDVRKRLKSINDHIPSEVVKDSWECIFQERMTTKNDAFAMEQTTLKALASFRTKGERVNCSEEVFKIAWMDMVGRKRNART